MEKVSIVIPVYNVEKYIPKCLDSILAQTYPEFEVICVDDASPDGSADIVRSYAERDARIRLVSQENTGPSGARIHGLEFATGKYTLFIDSDDWMDPDTLETAVTAAEMQKVDAVLWGYVRSYADKEIEKRIFDGNLTLDKEGTTHRIHRRMVGLVGEELANPENADAIVPVWGKLYRTDIIRDNHLSFVDTKIIGSAEDALFNLDYFGYADSCIFIDRPLHHYRKDNDSSFTRKYRAALPSQWNELFGHMRRYIEKNNCPEDFSQALDNRISMSMIGLGLNELSNPDGALAQIRNIRKILRSDWYRNAAKTLTLRYFPLHWKVFFFFCKHRMALCTFLLLSVMRSILGR